METITADGESRDKKDSPTDVVASESQTIGGTEFNTYRHRSGTPSLSVIRYGGEGELYVNLSLQFRPGQARALALMLLRIDTTIGIDPAVE